MPIISRERTYFLITLLFAALGLDQATKRIAEQLLSDKSYSFLYDCVRLQFIKNAGAFLGFGSQFSDGLKWWIFLFLPSLFLVLALIFSLVSKKLFFAQRVLIVLMVSGGMGNLIDRMLLSGQVTDFMNVGIASLRTGIFNVADVVIMFSAFGMLFWEFRKKSPAEPST
jgi:signal peptidase II